MKLTNEYDSHPFADIFQMGSEDYINRLAEDIGRNGQTRKITLFEGMVLDGRSRLLACVKAGVEPQFDFFEDLHQGSPIEWVVNQNLNRHHLTDSQRAWVGATIKRHFRTEAAKHNTNDAKVTWRAQIRAKVSEQAAKGVGVSSRSVEYADKVARNGDPALIEAVKRGDIAVSTAAVIANESAERQRSLVHAGPKAVRRAARKGANHRADSAYDADRFALFVGRVVAVIRLPPSPATRELLLLAIKSFTANDQQAGHEFDRVHALAAQDFSALRGNKGASDAIN